MQLKEYLNKYGISQRWFAKQLGIGARFFNFVVQGKRALPQKHWTNVILLTKGEVNLDDLNQLKEKYDNFYKSTLKAEITNLQRRNNRKLSEVQAERL